MNPTQTRCLVSSAVAHAAVVLALLLASTMATKRVLDDAVLPPLELVSLEGVRLTEGTGAGGGTPVPPPPAARTAEAPPPAPPAPPARSEPVPRREVRVAETPVRSAPAERPPVRVSQSPVRAQDTEPTGRPSGRRPVQVAAAPTRVTAADRARATAAAEAEARAQAEARERALREASERWRGAIGGIRSQLARGLSGQTEITVPGPGGGGEVWMGYGSYLKAFYEARWRRPSSLPVPVAYVGVAVTVSRDGRLTRFELLEKSGIKALDDSVLEVIQRHRQLEPLPAGTTDSERTFRIKFRLEGTTQ